MGPDAHECAARLPCGRRELQGLQGAVRSSRSPRVRPRRRRAGPWEIEKTQTKTHAKSLAHCSATTFPSHMGNLGINKSTQAYIRTHTHTVRPSYSHRASEVKGHTNTNTLTHTESDHHNPISNMHRKKYSKTKYTQTHSDTIGAIIFSSRLRRQKHTNKHHGHTLPHIQAPTHTHMHKLRPQSFNQARKSIIFRQTERLSHAQAAMLPSCTYMLRTFYIHHAQKVKKHKRTHRRTHTRRSQKHHLSFEFLDGKCVSEI